MPSTPSAEKLDKILPFISDLSLDDLESLISRIQTLIVARRKAAYEALERTEKPALLAQMGQVDRLVERLQDITSPNSAMIHVSKPSPEQEQLASSRKYYVVIVFYTERSPGDTNRTLQPKYVEGRYSFQVSLNPGDQKVFDFPVPWNEMPQRFRSEILRQANSLPQGPRS